MQKKSIISHEGVVKKVDGTSVTIMIVSKSACSNCHAKGACNASDISEKIIDAVAKEPLKKGDFVEVEMEELLGWVALIYSFGIPFIILFTVLVGVFVYTENESLAGIASLAILPPYYGILYLFRKRIEKKFTFEAYKKRN